METDPLFDTKNNGQDGQDPEHAACGAARLRDALVRTPGANDRVTFEGTVVEKVRGLWFRSRPQLLTQSRSTLQAFRDYSVFSHGQAHVQQLAHVADSLRTRMVAMGGQTMSVTLRR